MLSKLVKRLRHRYELRKCDRFTIADYFRKRGAQVGRNCSIIPTDLGTEPYLIKIGNNVAIAQGVRFITHDGGTAVFRREHPDLQVFGPIVIEDDCVIGQNAILMPNVRIGKGSIVAAGSVVVADVAPGTIAMGIPARAFGSVEKYKEKCLERWKMQRPPDVVVEPGETWWTSRHFQGNRDKLREHLLKVFATELA